MDGAIANGDVVVCTFTNTRTAPLPVPLPPIPPIPPPPTDPQIPVPPSAPTVDLSVRKTATPPIAVLGHTISFRITVTNLSPVDAADVNVVRVSERSSRLKVLSITPSQGTCAQDSCNLGRLTPHSSATITVVAQGRAVGRALNVVSVSSEEQETDYLNNTASALVRITDPPSEAKKAAVKAAAATLACGTLTVGPRALQAGATSIVLAQARTRFGKPLPGMPVIAEGSGVRLRVLTDRRGIAHLAVTPNATGLVHFRRARLTQSAGTHCRTLLGVLGSSRTVRHRLSSGYGSRSIGVPSGASRSRARATGSDTRTQPCDTAWPSSWGWFVPWMPARPAARPVAQLRVGARLQHEPAEERVARDEPTLHVEVSAERRLGARLANRHDPADQQPVVRDPAHEDPALADAHHDPVRDGVQVEELVPHPAPLPVRPARQAELVPLVAVGAAPGRDREDDRELPVGP